VGDKREPPLCTAGADPAGPADGTRKWSFCTLGGIQQVRALLWHRRAADCLPDAQVGSITLWGSIIRSGLAGGIFQAEIISE